MDQPEFESAPSAEQRPRNTTVLGLLVSVAGIFSYLGSYALSSAMVKADLVKPWTAGHDPRPKWFVFSFALLMLLFLACGALVRILSARHLKQIEAMEQE